MSGAEVRGLIDLARIGKGNGISIGIPADDPGRIQSFRATLDDQGRLVSFVIAPSSSFVGASLTYSGFGALSPWVPSPSSP